MISRRHVLSAYHRFYEAKDELILNYGTIHIGIVHHPTIFSGYLKPQEISFDSTDVVPLYDQKEILKPGEKDVILFKLKV